MENNRTIEIAIDRTVESLINPIENLQLMGRKEFQTQTTRLRNLYTKTMENAREQIHLEEKGILITDAETYSKYVGKCIEDGEYVLDIETTGLDPLNDIIVGLCIYSPSQKPAYVPLLHTDIDNKLLEGQIDIMGVKWHTHRLLRSKAKWINHNIKFDAKFLKYQWNIEETTHAIYWDTMIAQFLLNENETSHALKYLYAKYISKSKDKQSYNELFAKTPFNYVPLDLAEIYGANDGTKTYALYQFQKQYLNENGREDFTKLYKLFMDIEMPLLKVLVDMEITGVEIRPDFAEELKDKYQKEANELLDGLYATIDRFTVQIQNHPKLQDLLAKQAKNKKFKGTKYADKINFSSSQQKQILFYEILKFPKVNRQEPNSCGAATMQMWLDSNLTTNQRQFLKDYMKWAKLDKLITSFIEKIPKAVDLKTNAVHTNFNQVGTVTGRFSSSHPIHKINLQQIPSKDKYIRKIFKAREGKVLIGSDFSQIEPRILASLSKDEKMIDAYRNGTDLYAMMASEIFSKPYEECLEFHPVTGEKQPEGKDRRTQVKSVLLGIMYGRSPASIASQFGKSKAWGEKVVEDFYTSFPSIRMTTLQSQYTASKLGYVSTICGRKRRLPDMKLDKEDYRYISATRQCLNAIIQGSSADIMKIAMIEVSTNPRMIEIGAKPLITVHDELIIEVDRQYALEAGELMSTIMKRVGERLTGLVMKCDVEISEIWTGEDISKDLKGDL